MKNLYRNKFITILIIAINVVFVFGLFLAEYQYIFSTRKQTVSKNEESFFNTNTSLVSMTNNYLVGERNLCRSWSNYLNANPQTMDDAIQFVKESISDSDVMGHIVYKSKAGLELRGYSTRPNALDSTNFEVNYSSISGMVFSGDSSENVQVSSSYVNPINGSPSIAFYTEIKLLDPDDLTQEVDAYLLRVVLRDNFKQRWTFPSGSFTNLQVSITDLEGNYIIQGAAFKNSNFFEFYKSYNKTSDSSLKKMMQEITTNNGLLTMNNARSEECYIAYSRLTSPVDWIILTYTPAKGPAPRFGACRGCARKTG